MPRSLETCLSELGISPSGLALRGLVAFKEAGELSVVQVDPDGREHCLIPAAAKAWQAMKNAALNEGVELVIVSAFRSIERQSEIIRRKLQTGMDIADILAVSAAPGYSEHHTGRAVDLAAPGEPVLETGFEETKAFRWLSDNASVFGFRMSYPKHNSFGYVYEPWHWCYQTSDAASDPDSFPLST